MDALAMNGNGGLSHLVEAAAALTQLNTKVSTSKKPELKVPPTAVPEQPAAAKSQSLIPSKKDIFPLKLMEILDDESLSDIVTWLPHGRSFVIIRPDLFTEQVLPKYLPPLDPRASTKYPSFTRKLNRWGFRQATRGPDTGAFHHPLFQRGMPHLCTDMVCQRSKDRPKSKKEGKASSGGKNHKITPLTKESLEAMAPTTGRSFVAPKPATVSEDSISDTSGRDDGSSVTSAEAGLNKLAKHAVSSDKNLVEVTLRQRDEIERLKVARAMLFEAYKNALAKQQ